MGRIKVNDHLMSIDYDKVAIKVEDFIFRTSVNYKEKKRSFFGSPLNRIATRSWGWPMGVMKCFSFDVPFKKGNLLSTITINFNNSIFPDGKRPSDGWGPKGLMIFHHYPGQFGRSFATNRRFWNDRTPSASYRMRFYLNGMEILKTRQKRSEKCQDYISYDKWMVKNITEELQCYPPYWIVNEQYPVCNTQEKLYRAQQMFWNYFYGLEESNTPCTEIQKVDMSYEETEDFSLDSNVTRIQLYYLAGKYKEIRQMKAYTAMMLFGNIGGFMGLLLGYALVQIPGLMQSIMHNIKAYYLVAHSRDIEAAERH